MAQEILAIIEKIIEQHKVIFENMESLTRVANDSEAIGTLEKAKDTFMPGRLEHKDSLGTFKDLFEKVYQGLKSHFYYEETALLSALQKAGDEELMSALKTLLVEHNVLRTRLDDARRHLTDLTGGQLSRQTWEAIAHDMRAHITQTRKLLDGHVRVEMELLGELRKKYQEVAKG